MRIFALEYISQILNSDPINFMAAKKKTQFTLKNQIGPFIFNRRDVEKEEASRLLEYKLEESFPWNYDPQGILSKLRVKCKLTPFTHESKPEIEKFANQIEQVENTLTEAVNQRNTNHTLEISKQLETSTERIREEGAYTAETTTETNFEIIYNKRPKLDTKTRGKVTIYVEETQPLNTNTDFPETNVATVVISEPNQNEEQLNNEDAQLMERQQIMEASSSHLAEEKDFDIKEKYKQIKLKNEEIKTEIYSHFLK